jgi:hypothetical protein
MNLSSCLNLFSNHEKLGDFQGQLWRNGWRIKETQRNIGSTMIDLYHTKKDRKSLHQIIQIFIFNVDRSRTL